MVNFLYNPNLKRAFQVKFFIFYYNYKYNHIKQDTNDIMKKIKKIMN